MFCVAKNVFFINIRIKFPTIKSCVGCRGAQVFEFMDVDDGGSGGLSLTTD